MLLLFRMYLIRNRDFILDKYLDIKGLMQLLMKTRNAGEHWTPEEQKKLKKHFINLSWTVPALIIFFLPGGTLLLIILAEILHRIKQVRESRRYIPVATSSHP